MKHPMIVDTVKKDWRKCDKTGRHLNLNNRSIQRSSSCIDNELLKIEVVYKAIELSKEFKLHYKKTTKETMQVVTAIYSWLLSNPERMLRIDTNIKLNEINLIKQQGLKKVIEKMESLNHIIIYQGYTYKDKHSASNKAIPMCIESLL